MTVAAAFDGSAQVLGDGIVGPLVRSRTIPSALCRDHTILGMRCDCFSRSFSCAVKRRWSTAGERSHPGTGSLQPVAIGAAVEATKPLLMKSVARRIVDGALLHLVKMW